MVHRTGVINLLLFEPPFHCIFHFWAFAIRMRSLSTDDLEEMILSVSTIVLWATTIWVSEIISDLCESICSLLSSFLDSNYVQINTITWVLLFNSFFKYLLSHVELVILWFFRNTLLWTNTNFNVFWFFCVLFQLWEQSFPIRCFIINLWYLIFSCVISEFNFWCFNFWHNIRSCKPFSFSWLCG